MIYGCMVCRGDMPEDRMRKKGKTCSFECGRTLRLDYFRRRAKVKKQLRAGAAVINGMHSVPAQKTEGV